MLSRILVNQVQGEMEFLMEISDFENKKNQNYL